MNKYVTLLSAALVLLFSCTREAEQVIQPGETITFTAGWAGSEDTRTILQEDGTSVWWEPGAQVNVFFSDKASGKFTSTNSQAQAIVDFQGSLPIVVGSVETENPPHAYWAVYPYNAANTCDGESVTLTVPSTQTAKEGTFADKMFPSIATSTNFYLAFYNVCGGVRFTVANEEIASVTFKANNDESIAGKVKVGFDGAPVVKSVIEGTSEVVVNAPTGGFVPDKYYFATLLPQTLTKGVSLTFKKEDGKVASTSLENSITINRSRFGKMEEKDKGLEFKDDGSGHNPTDAIVFDDSKVKDKLVAAFDTNSDGELSYEEAAAVTSGQDLKAAFGAIKTYKSFDEFQYFTGITSIPTSMFESWNLLASVSIPESVLSIGGHAFFGCASLTNVIIPESVTSIGEDAISCCTSLTSITIPESVTSIGQYAFSSCTSLTNVIIPESVVSIGGGAFSGCTSLTSIAIPESVTSISNGVFASCTSLTNVIIPESVVSIESYAFSDCTSLTGIAIPASVTSLGNYAFSSCTSLTSITIPESVTSMGGGAFSSCTSLTSITIPESVTSIGNDVFSGCTSLTSITIPEGVASIGQYAFYGCTSLASITIPENVTSIEEYTFYGCTSLTNVIIPESVMRIKSYAFYGCTSLTNVIIPESVVSIEQNAFYGCTSLSSITIPESVTRIEEGAFNGCTSLMSIVIPKSVTSLGYGAFRGCSSLVSITVEAEIPPTGGGEMFGNTNNAPIYVPAEKVDTYKAAQYWSEYASRIQAIQE